jgi:hypothetical protein
MERALGDISKQDTPSSTGIVSCGGDDRATDETSKTCRWLMSDAVNKMFCMELQRKIKKVWLFHMQSKAKSYPQIFESLGRISVTHFS